MKLFIFACALLACALASPAYPADSSSPTALKRGVSVPMDSVMAYLQTKNAARNDIELEMATIKSRSDLKEYMAAKHRHSNPIARLSDGAKRRFIASLKFNDRGITSYEYRDLEQELSPTEIYGVLTLFGIQHDTPMLKNASMRSNTDREIMDIDSDFNYTTFDHDGYECSARATCSQKTWTICTSNCRSSVPVIPSN